MSKTSPQLSPNLFEKISKGEIEILSPEIKTKISEFLDKLGYNHKQKKEWLTLFSKYWIAQSVEKLAQVLTEDQDRLVEKIFGTAGLEGLSQYVKILQDTDPKLHRIFVQVLQGKLTASLDHFVDVTLEIK